MSRSSLPHAALLGLALLLAGCSGGGSRTPAAPPESHAHEEDHGTHEESEGRVELAAGAREAAGIEVAPAGPRAIRETLDLPGEVVPNADRLAHIVPRFPGIAREVRKRLGDPVREGEVLAVIEGNQSLATYEVRSLISGTVIEKHLTLGEFVRDDADVYVVADLSNVWVNVAIYARDLDRIRPGQHATISAVAGGPSAAGRIDYIGPVVGEATRAATARVVVANPSRTWRPGAFVTARIVVAERRVSIAVPEAAVQRLEGQDHVFVEEGDGFAARAVTLGAGDGQWSEVVAGLAAGERVVTRGAFVLKSELVKSEAGHEH